jgi:2-oxoglutarate dehydrogenase E1 component
MSAEHNDPSSTFAGRLTEALQGNGRYLEELHAQWQQAPESLPATWRYFFEGFDLASCPRACVASEQAQAQANVAGLIQAYRAQGHWLTKIDPLGTLPEGHPDLALEAFGLDESRLDQVFDTGQLSGRPRATLAEILELLRDTYCQSIGVEYMHIQDPASRRWLQERMEASRNRPNYDRNKKMSILGKLIDAERFETFLQTRYPGQKRFSLEGAETLIPALHAFVTHATTSGVKTIIIGMPHRGRLNVLANILDKSYRTIFDEFEDHVIPDCPGGDGDVKYHKGYTFQNDAGVTLSLTANPSHLEAVNPVVEGRARAHQWRLDDIVERKSVVPLLIHGDAAFAGQGLVAETLNLSQLAGYRTGGTVHLVVNNQIGFTASPREARSSRYATDVMKMIEAPIFHVNGDDPEAVVYVTELALDYRQTFGADVAIDMLCYRRHGHSEIDDPAFTQPLMYQKIKQHPSARVIYTAKLRQSGLLTEDEEHRLEQDFKARLESAYELVKTTEPECTMEDCTENTTAVDVAEYSAQGVDTSVQETTLHQVADVLCMPPAGFTLQPKLRRRLDQLLRNVKGKGDVDWGFAELLAVGSLLHEGTPVRLSGQDSMRGTFTQRHAVWCDATTGEEYIPLNHVRPDQPRFCVYNSSLTEAAVLGFEYGYSLDAPEMLILWEAQFGDFANGAQVIIDQFIVSSAAKWQRTSGLVMLLPHGYEGQGPEHSNGYLERYLMACAENNIQVCNLTTPAQYFHALRRQMKRDFRRPLVIMSPKSLLRHPQATSYAGELMQGQFHEVLDDPTPPANPKRLVWCTGKVYYDLLARRAAGQGDDAAIVRIEQLYPFPNEQCQAIVSRYDGITKAVWAQEEPENRGAYRFIRPQLEALGGHPAVTYAGRAASASPATGSLSLHRLKQEELVNAALRG